MEVLYHQTNRILQEITGSDLVHLERARTSEEIRQSENVLQQKLNTIQGNCERLDILVNKEPPQRRSNAKYRVDQLKYDFQHVLNSFRILQQRYIVRQREEEEREALLNRKFTTNDQQETSIFMDDMQHKNKLEDANRHVDEMLGIGATVLEGLKDQGSTLKGAHKKVMDLANTLGLSNTVIRAIEKRSTQDKFILFAGMVIVLIFLYLILRYL